MGQGREERALRRIGRFSDDNSIRNQAATTEIDLPVDASLCVSSAARSSSITRSSVFSLSPRGRGRGRGGEAASDLLNIRSERAASLAQRTPFALHSSPCHGRSGSRCSAASALSLALYAFCLPRPLFNEPYSYVLLGRDGTLLSARAASDGHWRFPMHGEVPKKFEQALLRFEDKRFYSHPGVDPIAMSRALYLERHAQEGRERRAARSACR